MAVTSTRVVGDLFLEGRHSWREMASLRLRGDEVEVVQFVASPDTTMVTAAAHGRLRWAWAGSERGALLRVELGDNEHHVPLPIITYHARNDVHDGLGPSIDDLTADTGLQATVVLVDALTGLIMAVSAHRWPARIATLVQADLRLQMSSSDTPDSPTLAMAELVSSYGGGSGGVNLLLRDRGTSWETSPHA